MSTSGETPPGAVWSTVVQTGPNHKVTVAKLAGAGGAEESGRLEVSTLRGESGPRVAQHRPRW